MHYIGMDVHIATIDFATVDEKGKVKHVETIKTSAKGIIEYIKKVPGPKVVVVEEGTLSSWVKETVEGIGEKLVISDPRRNKWIGGSGHKSDRIDAKKLALLMRGGYIKEIYHPGGEHRRFKELVLHHHDLVKAQTRVKNKLKAKFRQNGISCRGQTVYQEENNERWLGKLPQCKKLEWQVKCLWEQLKLLEGQIQTTKQKLAFASKKYPEVGRFQKVKGIGLINAVTICAIISTPHRFADKKKLWGYAGLGIVKRQSSDKVYSERLTQDYNRLLKNVFKSAAQSAIRSKDNQFRAQYLKLTMRKGVLPYKAQLTVARTICSTIYGMWIRGADYVDQREKKKELAA